MLLARSFSPGRSQGKVKDDNPRQTWRCRFTTGIQDLRKASESAGILALANLRFARRLEDFRARSWGLQATRSLPANKPGKPFGQVRQPAAYAQWLANIFLRAVGVALLAELGIAVPVC